MSHRTFPSLASATPAAPSAWFARAVIFTIGLLFIGNNLLPFLGLHDFGALQMYSGLSVRADNHLFMPRIALSDADVYVSITRLVSRGADTPELRRFQALKSWADDHRGVVLLNVVRYQADRTCRSAPGSALRLTLTTDQGATLDYPNVCDEPNMRHYSVISAQEGCIGRDCDFRYDFTALSESLR